MKGQHLRKIEGRAQRWAARFDVDGSEQAPVQTMIDRAASEAEL